MGVERSSAPISIANGGQILVLGTRQKDTFIVSIYLNETNGDNSVDELRKTARRMMFGGAAGMLAGLAVLLTVGIAAYREPSFLSSGGVGRTAIYLISAVGALALGTISLFFLAIGAFGEGNIRMIDEEHRKSTPPK